MRDRSVAIERLGVPEYHWQNEGVHGVGRAGEATVFPQAIGLAATWDPDLVHRVADTIATEARAKHHEAARQGDRGRFKGLTMWAPLVNIARDPRWGRCQETYGEDPFLTSRMAVAFIRGLQGDDPLYLKAAANPKHFATFSGPMPERKNFRVAVDRRTLHEVYLPAFKACVQEGQATSIVTGQHRLLGKACSANPELLQGLLRDEWGFDGCVLSDFGAVRDIFLHHRLSKTFEEAAAMAVRAGCDLISGGFNPPLVEAVRSGLVAEEEIDRSVSRLLELRMRLGLFDPPERVPYAAIPYEANCLPEHRDLALKAARKAIVLLKNDGVLPLRKDLATIAVIGPNADSVEALMGTYYGDPRQPVTVVEGITRKVSGTTSVLFERGCALIGSQNEAHVIGSLFLRCEMGNGLMRQYYDNPNLEGEPVDVCHDPEVSLHLRPGKHFPNLKERDFSIRWSGEVVPPRSGKYIFQVTGHDGFRLAIDDKTVIDEWQEGRMRTAVTGTLDLEAGKPYPLRLEIFQTTGDTVANLAWRTPVARSAIERAVDCARRADVAIVVGGLSGSIEGEFKKVNVHGFQEGDRTTIRLPAVQKRLIRQVQATGTPTVLVLLSGGVVVSKWADANVQAIVHAWYPGEKGGTAIADVLFGDYNPAGRLPVTFYRWDEDLPPMEDYRMDDRTYMYFQGEPLYPFGHGLSYTRFVYSNLGIDNPNPSSEETAHVSLNLRNVGERDGDEVVQLYVRETWSEGLRPLRRLKGFERVRLAAGEIRELRIPLPIESLAYYDEDRDAFRVLPGEYEIEVGASSADIRLRDTIRVREGD
ncbi:glycoside hydrolase family 3 C-terminal domain-containing protein [Candidatus Sumerlaeota bacterium]|nr:glycoside hydrolase family 3 C-terminal domain-containing protein [Candidatus Sumerlaeota bacterium]